MTTNLGPWPIDAYPPIRTHATANITPFTYYDGATFLEILSELRTWLRDTLIPGIDNVINIVDDLINNALEGVEQDLAVMRQEVSDALASVAETDTELRGYVDDVLQQVINNSIELQDPVAAALVNDDTSQTRTALDGAFVEQGKTRYEGSSPFVEIANQSEHATLHLSGGPQDRPYIVGVGNDAGSSPGFLVANKANGHGMYLDNHPTATQAGFFGAKRSSARLMHLVATTAATSPILELQVQPGVSENRAQPILRVMDGNGVVATFNRGSTEFYRNILVNAHQLLMSNPLDTPTSERSGVFIKPTGFAFKSSAGSTSAWFSTRIHAADGLLSLESGGEWGFNNGGKFNRIVSVSATSGLGFYGVTPVKRQKRPGYPAPTISTGKLAVTVSDMIAKLTLIGLWKDL